VPAFHIPANPLHDRERRFDHIRTGELCYAKIESTLQISELA
jgi:hypothetical protein